MRATSPVTHAAVVTLAVLASVACGSEDVDSSAIRTQGIYANYSVVASGDGDSTVTAQLRVGGDNGTIVKLTEGDELVVTVDGNSRTLGAIDNRERYRTTVSTDEGGTEFEIAFERAEDESAPDSRARLPEPFSLSLVSDSDLERGQPLEVEWEGGTGSGEVDWSVEGDCIWPEDGSAADDGSLTIDPSDIEVQSLDEGESCTVSLTVERSARGSIDPAFEEGGRFVAIQRRRVSFRSMPGPDEEAALAE